MAEKYEHCKRKFMWKIEYYKVTLRTILASLSVITVILLAVIGYSYKPISDIAVLKIEVKNIHEKLDILIKNGEHEKINYTETGSQLPRPQGSRLESILGSTTNRSTR